MSIYSDKFISQKKILRLSCYKQHKESQPHLNKLKSIADVCPFKFTEIQETCKHCRWFNIQDMTKDISQQIIDSGVSQDKQVILKLKDFEELPYDPKNKNDSEV